MKRINVVLHRPVYSRNIGMCARAMANMGAERLHLVEPVGTLDERARQGAAHAQDVLRNAIVYPSMSEFERIEGDGIRIALSGRAGVAEPKGLEETLASFAGDPEHPFHDPSVPIYLAFGTEADGLSNEEMALSHHICRLPTYGDITSFNLSHAVLLALYTVRAKVQVVTPEPVITPAPLYYPSETIKQWLEELGFDLSAPRVSIEKTLNRILLSRCPSQEELRILNTVVHQTLRRLREKSKT